MEWCLSSSSRQTNEGLRSPYEGHVTLSSLSESRSRLRRASRSVGRSRTTTLPEPHIVDDGESWEVIEDRSQFEDVVTFADGQCGENAAAFETKPSVGYVLALEPDGSDTEEEAVELAEVEQNGEFPAVDADIIEQQVRRHALQQEVVAVTGVATSRTTPPALSKRSTLHPGGALPPVTATTSC